MEAKKNADLISVIKETRLFLGFVGFYPLANDRHKTLQNIAAAFFLFVGVLYLGLGTTFVVQNLSNLGLVTDTIEFLLSQAVLTVKLVSLLYYRKNILRLEDMLKNPLFTEIGEEEEYMLMRSLRLSRMVKILTIIEAIINILFISIYTIVNKKISMKMWFPFSTDENFAVVGFYEILLGTVGTTFIFSIDVLTALYLDLCAAQFLLLKRRLTKIGLVLTGDEVLDNKVRVDLMKKYIVHHDYIYSFAKLLEETFSVGLFCQVICSSVIICFSLFKLLVLPPGTMRFAILLAYAYSMLVQLFIYCSFGQKVLNASDTITEACYMSKWYDCSLEVQKYIAVIMERAYKPVKITAGGIFSLNIDTLKRILSTTYSFLTIIWRIYTES